jgi:hypothetical protein
VLDLKDVRLARSRRWLRVGLVAAAWATKGAMRPDARPLTGTAHPFDGFAQIAAIPRRVANGKNRT